MGKWIVREIGENPEEWEEEWNKIENVKEMLGKPNELLLVCFAFRLGVIKFLERNLEAVKEQLEEYKMSVIMWREGREENGIELKEDELETCKWLESEEVKIFEELTMDDIKRVKERALIEAGIILASRNDSSELFKGLEANTDILSFMLLVMSNGLTWLIKEMRIVLDLENNEGNTNPNKKLEMKKALINEEESLLWDFLHEIQESIERGWAMGDE